MRSIEQLIAETLGVRSDIISDDLQFQSIPEWDSLNHVNLMLALEREYDLQVDAEAMVVLSDVKSIREFVGARTKDDGR